MRSKIWIVAMAAGLMTVGLIGCSSNDPGMSKSSAGNVNSGGTGMGMPDASNGGSMDHGGGGNSGAGSAGAVGGSSAK